MALSNNDTDEDNNGNRQREASNTLFQGTLLASAVGLLPQSTVVSPCVIVMEMGHGTSYFREVHNLEWENADRSYALQRFD